MSDAPRDCVHGQLARSCELCDLQRQLAACDAEIAALRDRIAVLEREQAVAARDVTT